MSMRALALSAPAEVRTGLHVRDVDCRDDWNAVVSALGGHLRQGWEWGALSGRPVDRRAIVTAGHAVAAIALTEIRIPGTPYTVLDAPRAPILGPRTARVWGDVVEAIRDVGARRRAVFARLSPGVASGDSEVAERLGEFGAVSLDDQWTLWNPPRVVMTSDLRGSEADLKQAMRASTRLGIRKAERRGARIERLTDADAVARFHRLLIATGKRRGYPVRRLEYFEALRQEYFERDAGAVILASLNDRDIAGVLGVRFGRTAYVLYSAIDPEFRELRGGVAVHWDLIRWARERGAERLDWGGSVTRYPPTIGDAGYGVYDFKRGFGCTLTLLAPYFDLVLRPRLYRAFRFVEKNGGWLAALRARWN
jgi:hypothetical protein